MIWSKEPKEFWEERAPFNWNSLGKCHFPFRGFKLWGCGHPCIWERRTRVQGRISPALCADTGNRAQSLASAVIAATGREWLGHARLGAAHFLSQPRPSNPVRTALILQRGEPKVGELEWFSKSQKAVVLGRNWGGLTPQPGLFWKPVSTVPSRLP